MKHMSSRFVFCIKTLQIVALAVAVYFSVGVTDASARFYELGHKMMCTCGCAQLLGECNHVGCQQSTKLRNELTSAIAAGMSDKNILSAFAAKYGVTVLAAPPAHGFDLVAWIAPFAVLLAAIAGTVLLVRRWSISKDQVAAEAKTAIDSPEERDLRDRIRLETGNGEV